MKIFIVVLFVGIVMSLSNLERTVNDSEKINQKFKDDREREFIDGKVRKFEGFKSTDKKVSRGKYSLQESLVNPGEPDDPIVVLDEEVTAY